MILKKSTIIRIIREEIIREILSTSAKKDVSNFVNRQKDQSGQRLADLRALRDKLGASIDTTVIDSEIEAVEKNEPTDPKEFAKTLSIMTDEES